MKIFTKNSSVLKLRLMKITMIVNYDVSAMTMINMYDPLLLPVIVPNLCDPGIENSQYLLGQKCV